ncbi:hypothetical protein VFPPC_06222 [Pochonia chlamydosporia 170]|uniref:Uncharacterized protein n=1 Tax=Pochonia chlamydosporia 170 TaxID=1380566 RepID=A0A179FHZ2_METCM|nr:hypothetical protein VFPPC_06222 [Pochonia chlamydosporia 170]OAQ65047.1 hypothetical protein VFPPC_06222 [Pochonia chlamydosporia 170]
MHSASAITLLSALSVLVNAAPAIDKRQGPATRTITQKAPFQELEKLPVLPNGVTVVDLNMSEYASFGYPEDSDQFKCHGTCGAVIRIANTPEKCTHPYAQPFVNFCFGPCLTLKNFKPYGPAQKFKDSCNLVVTQPRSSTVVSTTSTTAESPSSTISTNTASLTSTASVAYPTESPASSGHSASPSKTSSLPTGSAAVRPSSHPSGVVSGTASAPTATGTPISTAVVTAGAANASFNVLAAITVATLAIIIS